MNLGEIECAGTAAMIKLYLNLSVELQMKSLTLMLLIANFANTK